MKLNFNEKLYLDISDDTLEFLKDGQISLEYDIRTNDTDEIVQVSVELKEKVQVCLNNFFNSVLTDFIKESYP
jgi:hypothetical protein